MASICTAESSGLSMNYLLLSPSKVPFNLFLGEFTILMLQVARFLIKNITNLQKGKKLAPSVDYLQALGQGSLKIDFNEERLGCPHYVSSILRAFACLAIKKMAAKLAEGAKQGFSQKEIWDTYAGISLTEGAIAHTIYTMHGFFL